MLEVRIGIILAKKILTHQDKLNLFQLILLDQFDELYSLNDIKEALNHLENNHLIEIYELEKEAIVLNSHEDYEIKSLTQLV